MRLKSDEQLGTFGQCNFHLYHQRETYFFLSERQNDVVHGSESRRWEIYCRIVIHREQVKAYRAKKQQWEAQ